MQIAGRSDNIFSYKRYLQWRQEDGCFASEAHPRENQNWGIARNYGGASVKKLPVTAFIAVIIVMFSVPAFAEDLAFEATADILIVRPVSLAATVVGTAVFIVSLPFSIPSQSVGATAKTLVAEPFNFTFTRPIGDFSGERTRGKVPDRELQPPAVEAVPETEGPPAH